MLATTSSPPFCGAPATSLFSPWGVLQLIVGSFGRLAMELGAVAHVPTGELANPPVVLTGTKRRWSAAVAPGFDDDQKDTCHVRRRPKTGVNVSRHGGDPADTPLAFVLSNGGNTPGSVDCEMPDAGEFSDGAARRAVLGESEGHIAASGCETRSDKVPQYAVAADKVRCNLLPQFLSIRNQRRPGIDSDGGAGSKTHVRTGRPALIGHCRVSHRKHAPKPVVDGEDPFLL